MNGFGRIFRLSIFGESHGPCVGVVVDGCPAGIILGDDAFEADMRRRQGGARGATARREADVPIVESGVHCGRTTGAPILIRIANTDADSASYADVARVPRPGHADLVAARKFGGWNDPRGGGHFSGRLTAALVAAGVIAKHIVEPVRVRARVLEAGGRADASAAAREAARDGDSIGAIVECRASGVPLGLGEPFFDSLESQVSRLAFSLGGVRGIEFGSGFACARMRGTECNDLYLDAEGRTATNHAGGVNGGLTNGNEIVFRVAVKPTSSIAARQRTVDLETGRRVSLSVAGRHDACIGLRMPVILEAVLAVVLADFTLLDAPRARGGGAPHGARRSAPRRTGR
ncbi:MAG: chorismate synthase [Deltaproteobacteria bacterium]|nr:chorismate synthase [Deltaproteobacteria bacterium]